MEEQIQVEESRHLMSSPSLVNNSPVESARLHTVEYAPSTKSQVASRS